MEKYVIHGGNRLTGEIRVSGAKNAAVAILPATILAQGVFTIDNVPQISDIFALIDILQTLGATCEWLNDSTLRIDTTKVENRALPSSLTSSLRASYYFIGSLLGRFNYANVATPGGCLFGKVRPIDMHIQGFQALGAKIPPVDEEAKDDIVIAKAEPLLGAYIYFNKVSVGATINVMLAAVRAKGLTTIENAAREPHVVDLANFLNRMGAKIEGAGTNVIKIKGCQDLHAVSEYTIIPDQIEAGTYMVAAAATRGDLTITNVTPEHLDSITVKLRECGVAVDVCKENDRVRVYTPKEPRPCTVCTQPHPGFPTDMQSQFAVLLCTCEGDSTIIENVWEDRFKYIKQLSLMNARIEQPVKSIALIHGGTPLKGAAVKADDLRAGAAMILAGLCAEGETVVSEIHHVERGYENIVGKLRACGADISKKEFPDEPKDDKKDCQ